MAYEIGTQVPYSTGRNNPIISVPENACDSHHHIYDPIQYPYQPTDTRNQPPATVECYQLLQKRLGTTRNVIIQPSAYGTDNRCTLDALKKMGAKNTRAVVVVNDDISESELIEMDALGVRGIRVNISCGAADDLDSIQKIAEKIAPLHWSMCFWMSADLTVSIESFLRNLPCEIVFDHRGHIPADLGIHHPAFNIICDMLRDNKAWVKLSGLYMDSKKADFSDTIAIGKGYVNANPDRCLWGTDWPHPRCYTNHEDMPNDSDMLDDLMKQAGTEENLHKILVDNPARLFDFKA